MIRAVHTINNPERIANYILVTGHRPDHGLKIYAKRKKNAFSSSSSSSSRSIASSSSSSSRGNNSSNEII